jgi:hypothetical protein
MGSMTDLTDRKQGAARLDIFLKDVSSIGLGSLRSLHDLDLLLPALKEVQQFARLTIQSTSPETLKASSVLINYMQKKTLFTIAPVFSAESAEPYGLLIIYPSVLEQISMKLEKPNLPDKLSGTYFVAFCPWLITPSFFIDSETVIAPGLAISTQKDYRREIVSILPPWEGNHTTHRIRDKPDFARSLRILGVPPALAESLGKSDRRVFVWSPPKRPENREATETNLLLALFNRYRHLTVESSLGTPRWIFVHQSAVQSLSELNNFSMLRAQRPELMILLYGTSPSVDPRRWRIRQIFPLGGVITFTLSAILRDPLHCFEIAGQVKNNKLWACYILPCVIGGVAKRICGNEDPWKVYQRRDFILTRLMAYIGEGTIALSQAPPDKLSPDYANAIAQWAQIQYTGVNFSAQQILESCVTNFEALFEHLAEEQQTFQLIRTTCKDLSMMQQQHAMMDNYRRFVAIVPADQITHCPMDHSIEVMPLKDFRFKDLQLKQDVATLPPDLEQMNISEN